VGWGKTLNRTTKNSSPVNKAIKLSTSILNNPGSAIWRQIRGFSVRSAWFSITNDTYQFTQKI